MRTFGQPPSLGWSDRAGSLKSLQNSADSMQYFARQLVIRGGACQRHRSDERAHRQDRPRSCRTLVLAGKQTGDQLNIVPDLFGGKSAGPLIAAGDLRRQRAEGAARAWIVAVRFVQILVYQFGVGDRRPAR